MLESRKIDQLCKAEYVPKASNMMKGMAWLLKP